MPKEGLSRLSEKCRACPFVDKCDHKEMEALAYLLPPNLVVLTHHNHYFGKP